jgi:cell division protein FtsB
MKTKLPGFAQLLAVVIVLQALILATLWFGGPLQSAQAQIPDAGAQRDDQINQARLTNAKLDQLIELLQSGKLQVIVGKPDNSTGAPPQN